MAWGDKKASLIIRIPRDLRAALKRLAKEQRDGKGLTLSEYAREVLQREVDKADKAKGR